MAEKISTFTISDLKPIQSFDHEDLLMVSDYDATSCFTRNMSFGYLLSSMTNDSILSSAVLDVTTGLGSAIYNAISSSIASKVAEEVAKLLTADMTDKVLKIILDNHAEVQDRLDGVVNDTYVIGQ